MERRYTLVVYYYGHAVNEALDQEIITAIGRSPIWQTGSLKHAYKRHMIFRCGEDEIGGIAQNLKELQEASPFRIEFCVKPDPEHPL